MRTTRTGMGTPTPRLMGSGPSATDTVQRLQNDASQSASNWLHSYLKKQMTVSKRKGGWFRLEKRERSMFSLALRLNASFKGSRLLKAMFDVLRKLTEASGAVCARLALGVQMAWTFASNCARWGNLRAEEWRGDLEYAKYLGSHMCGGSRL